MKAFHNDESIKQKYLNRVEHHIKADNLIRGTGWERGKGCAVGCTLEAYDHKRYEAELGIPEWLAKLEDTLFEGMTLEKSKTWPKVFLEAINVGADLDKVKTPFIVFVLKENLTYMDNCKYDAERFPKVKDAIEGSKKIVFEMIKCHEQGLDLSAAESAVRSGAWTTGPALASPVASPVESVAWSAVWSARSALASEARLAVESAARSAAWSVGGSAARTVAYNKYADKLIELLKQTKV